MKAVVFTLGCKVNECESDALLSGLSDKGYEVSDKLEYADLYIVNTCAVTGEAEKKSRQTESRIKRLNPDAKIIFTGCACEKCPQSFSAKSPNYLITGTQNKSKILDLLDSSGEMLNKEETEFAEMPTVKTRRTRTYIKVQDGCDNFCSYCIIPYLRKRSRSRKIENVLKEIKSISPTEAVITGINLSDYNVGGKNLTDLILALKDEDCRIRLGSLEVGVIDEKFLTALKSLKNFAEHFHLSLQSGSDSVLKKMNRHYTKEEYIKKVNLIRRYFPDAGITTDIIVGFPTETEEDFAESVNLAKAAEFSDIHAFPFSRRSGTVAYKMQDLSPEIKKERLSALLKVKHELKINFANKMTGKTLDFLPEEYQDGYAVGYTGNYLRVYVLGAPLGKIIKVKIIKPYLDGAIGEI